MNKLGVSVTPTRLGLECPHLLVISKMTKGLLKQNVYVGAKESEKKSHTCCQETFRFLAVSEISMET